MVCYVRDHHLFSNPETDLTHNEIVHNRFFKNYFQNVFVLLSENGLFDMLHFTEM